MMSWKITKCWLNWSCMCRNVGGCWWRGTGREMYRIKSIPLVDFVPAVDLNICVVSGACYDLWCCFERISWMVSEIYYVDLEVILHSISLFLIQCDRTIPFFLIPSCCHSEPSLTFYYQHHWKYLPHIYIVITYFVYKLCLSRKIVLVAVG